MRIPDAIHSYFVQLPAGKLVLWCYLIWYLVTVTLNFDSTPSIWLNSLGISVVVGFALMLSVAGPEGRPDRWQVARLFVMPFCVSSFSSLIKGRDYVLVAPTGAWPLSVSIGSCVAFVVLVFAIKANARRGPLADP
jgi:hypothetical protein